MPEIPEVEEAAVCLSELAKDKTVAKVVVQEDLIVLSGVSGASFATRCEGKVVRKVGRKGKNFYLSLSDVSLLFHFGMSGTSHIRGKRSPTYHLPRGHADKTVWPPKYHKVLITFANDDGSVAGEWAFCDARRLGRVRMVDAEDPEKVEPLSLLGADPLLDMPSVDALAAALTARKAPIKAVLLDQHGPLCGLGNWMVDEILFQSRIHPSHPSSALSAAQMATLHYHIRDVTVTAVSANADATRFPPHWIFSSRWGKGKKDTKNMIMASGESYPITFETVGGRTSAVVAALQVLPSTVAGELLRKKGSVRKASSAKEAATTPVKRKNQSQSMGEKSDDDVKEATSPYFKRARIQDVAKDKPVKRMRSDRSREK